VRCDACGVLEEAHLSQPRKHICGRYWRPDLVWAGDALPQPALDQALEAIRKCQLLVSVGTSARLEPAAELPLEARSRGARLIEINPEETRLSKLYDRSLRGPASTMLSLLLQS